MATNSKHKMIHIRVRDLTYNKLSAEAAKREVTQQSICNDLIERHYFGETLEEMIEKKLKTLK